jgi:hypothetical protein
LPGSVTTADGTVIAPPTQIVNNVAPTAQALATNLYTGTPEFRAFQMSKNYDAILQMIAQGKGAVV